MQRFVFGKAGHRLTDHLGGRLLVKAQPLFVAAQHLDVQKAFGMDAAVGDQAGEVVEAVFGHEGKAEAGDEQMVNLAVRGERAVAGDDVVAVFQGVGTQRGQKQRVAIASAIASNKQVIIFDEPTSGLDYRHMKKVAENLQKLSSLGKTLFIVTHDPELIAECCNYFVFIENGKVLWSDGWNRISRERLQQFFAFEE